MMRRRMQHVRSAMFGAALAIFVAGEVHAQTPATPVAAPAPTVPTPATSEAGPVYAPPAAPAETLPATPAPTPYTTPAPTPYTGPSTAPPAPANSYPTPGAQPPANGFDFGGMTLTPLPAPPAALDASRIRLQPWRGRYWIGFRLMITGPVGGEVPARPNLLTFSGGADFGVRLGNILGLGMGLSGHGQNRVRATVDTLAGPEKQVLTGRVLYWDALFARIHAPLRKRFQPYVEIGGGLARLDRAEGGRLYGAQMRAGLGLEGWVTRNVTLGLAGIYRLNALNDKPNGRWLVGHAMHGVIELGFHW